MWICFGFFILKHDNLSTSNVLSSEVIKEITYLVFYYVETWLRSSSSYTRGSETDTTLIDWLKIWYRYKICTVLQIGYQYHNRKSLVRIVGKRSTFVRKKVFSESLKQFICAWCQKLLKDRYKMSSINRISKNNNFLLNLSAVNWYCYSVFLIIFVNIRYRTTLINE